MTWIGIAFFLAIASALVTARRQLAEMQALVIGARIGPGCVIAEAAVVALLAAAIFVFRESL